MANSAVHDKIMDIISTQLDVDRNIITPESNVIDDLGADSLDIVELVMALEDAFDLEIPDEDAGNIRTVKDITDYLDKKKAA